MEVFASLKERISVCASVFAMSLMGILAMRGAPATVPPSLPIVQPQAVQPQLPMPESKPQIPSPPTPTDPELIGLHVPLPKELRIYNKSGSQCVWCTAQMLGTLNHSAGVAGLTDQYKHATGPGEFNRVMTSRKVKFKQVTGRDLDFIEEWVTKKHMGVGIGINNSHCILVCHFERGKQVKIIDNSDRQLRVQTWTWDRFTRAFTGWVFVILPDDTSIQAEWDNNVDDGKLYR